MFDSLSTQKCISASNGVTIRCFYIEIVLQSILSIKVTRGNYNVAKVPLLADGHYKEVQLISIKTNWDKKILAFRAVSPDIEVIFKAGLTVFVYHLFLLQNILCNFFYVFFQLQIFLPVDYPALAPPNYQLG